MDRRINYPRPPLVAAFAILAALAACNSLQQYEWIVPIGGLQQSRKDARTADKLGNVLYVATGADVYMLSYPSGKLVGNLGVVGHDLCADVRGNVFVPTGSAVDEFNHYGELIQTIESVDVPLSCASDPKTGNLAVTFVSSGAGYLAVYPNAKPPAQAYSDSEIGTYGLLSYDDQGDLFVDGSGSGNILAELPRGSSMFVNYTLSSKFDVYDSLQWDGRYVTLSNLTNHVLYRVTFDHRVRVAGATRVHGWRDPYYGHWPYIQTWLEKGVFIAQWTSNAELGLWPYPKGGRPGRIIGPFLSGSTNIYGVVLSQGPTKYKY